MVDPRPVVRVDALPGLRAAEVDGEEGDPGGWPYSIPAVADLMRDGLDLDDVTILVGENGSGKSTIVEAVAMAYGLNAEGGSTGARNSTWASESPLHRSLRLVRGGGASKWGYFLRAETMHGLFSYLQASGPERDFHSRSHGEAFWEMVTTSRFDGRGFFVFDEPEAGLSFDAQLRLLAMLHEVGGRRGAQVLLATHSPVLAALPGATIHELSDAGLRRARWDELAMVDHHRRFLAAPERYLDQLLD